MANLRCPMNKIVRNCKESRRGQKPCKYGNDGICDYPYIGTEKVYLKRDKHRI